MKQILLLILAICTVGMVSVNAQVTNLTPDQIKTEKDGKVEEIKKLQGEIDKLDATLANMDYTGWKFGGAGGAIFNANGSSNWASLGSVVNTLTGDTVSGVSGITTAINVDLFANYKQSKYFWFNGLNLQQTFNVNLPSGILDGDLGLGDILNRTSDKLYFQSLGGYRINSELAASANLDLNSSLSNFLNPATLSVGVGVTWTPTEFMDGKLIPLKVVFHPLTWRATIMNVTDTADVKYNFDQRIGFGLQGDETIVSDFGLKFIADYSRNIKILGNSIAWTTRLKGFAPYTSFNPLELVGGELVEGEAIGPMEFDWENAFSVLLFKNINLTANWNLRNSKAEYDGWQHLWNAGFGLSTTF